MECTGAQILLESMKREGVDVLFGYPGGAVIDIYDELPRHPELRHVLVRHEQGAVHAADGYARASGKTGVCLVTSGPGATNTVTGIATAYSDSIPLVIFTGQVPTQLIGNDAFQEVDIVGITRPCTKHNFLVKDISKLALTIRQAFYLARSGRPGPVLVDLPKDVMQKRTEFVWPEDVYMRSYNPTYKPNLNQLRRSVEELARAERPVILAGGGVIMSNAAEALTSLARKLQIPVTCSLMGLGAFPATDPLWLGMVGMHGTYAANLAINNADVLVCVGARSTHGKADHVTPDDVQEARLAAQYLFDHGATNLAVIGSRTDPEHILELRDAVEGNAQLRLRGIIEETRRRGLSLDPQLIGNTDQDWTIGAGARVTQRLIDSGVPFDGVIALNDQLAIGALTALRTAGYEVPVQVQVIGFDNNEEAPYLQIPLTTMDSRLDWTAPTAVNRILGRIDGSITKSELLTTESQVIARASTR